MMCRAKAYTSVKQPPSLEVNGDGGSSPGTGAAHGLADGGAWAGACPAPVPRQYRTSGCHRLFLLYMTINTCKPERQINVKQFSSWLKELWFCLDQTHSWGLWECHCPWASHPGSNSLICGKPPGKPPSSSGLFSQRSSVLCHSL